MKTKLIGCLICSFLFCNSTWSQSTKTAEMQKAVAAMEQRWLESQKKNNPDLIASAIADEFVATSSDGKLSSRTEMLASAKASKYSHAEYGDLKVNVFGNTAIARGFEILKGTDESGKPLDVNERFTDTWVKMPDGKWRCVASHLSTNKK